MKRSNQNKRHKQHRISNKAGSAPGTVTYTGEDRSFKVLADVFTWDEDFFEEKKGVQIQDIQDDVSENKTRWINVIGIHDTAAIEHLGKIYNIHSLVQEDIAHATQRAKLDDYEDYLYLVAKMIEFNDDEKHINTEQISIILRGNTILSFIEDNGDLFDGLRDRIRKGNLKVRKSGSDYVLYSLLDAIVDNYFVVLERIGDQLEETEMNLLSNPKSSDIALLHELKRELILLRKSIWPMREILGHLSKNENIHLTGSTILYMRDVYDHCMHAIDTLETNRDLTSGMMDVYLSSLSNKMNEVMKTLTVISTIFIPLTFIVGIYGMNFKKLPFIESDWGYLFVLCVLGAVTIGMLFYFKRRRWF